MNTYNLYLKFCEENKQSGEDRFFCKLAQEFDCSVNCSYLFWFAEQRSWFKPEMIDELIRMDKNGEDFPNLLSGDFRWENNKFLNRE